jgi:ribonuclease HII
MGVTLDLEQELWTRGLDVLAGIDEAGRGPLAGPVVAAAVILPKDLTIPGVDDSKKLSEKRRELMFDEVCSRAVAYGIGIVDHEAIDRLNILQATILAMHRAIDGLSLLPQFLLVDGTTFRHESIPFRTVVDGDARSLTIAAASIVAKVTRDRLMRQYAVNYPAYGFERNKGYGTPEHLEAIKRFGYCPIHRRSFHIHRLDKNTPQ